MLVEPEKIRNILVVRNDRFGEFLLNIPALRALKETFIDARIITVVDPYVKELAECISYIDELIVWGSGKHQLSEKIELISCLKGKNIDLAIMLNPCKEFNIFTYLAGIPIRVGYDRKWGFLLTEKIKDKKYLAEKHEVEYNLELVGLVGANTRDKRLSLGLKVNANDNLLNDLNIEDSDLIAVHPWTSDPLKQWPIENFCSVTEKLIKELNKKVIIIGGAQEQAKGLKYFNHPQENIINLTGKTSLVQLAALLKRCKLLISGDSGPVHLACAVGAPTIAIFRSDIPAKCARRWGPWGAGNFVIEKDNLNDISVDEVLEKAKEVLK